jgi:YaiO family outer membrane protein
MSTPLHSISKRAGGGGAAVAVGFAIYAAVVCVALCTLSCAAAAEPVARPHEAYSGCYLLDMGARGDGHNAYAGIRYRPDKRSLVYLQGDRLARFGREESKLLGGASFGIARTWNCAAELSVSPGAEMYPTAAAWIEIGKVAVKSLVVYGRVNHSAYRSASLSGISLAGEYYPPRWNCAVISRVSLSTNDFGGAARATDAGGLVKVIRFVGERSRAFVYGAAGSESYRLELVDRTGNLYANTFGIGGDYYPRPSLRISPSLEYQDRERGPRFLQFGLEAGFLW